MKKKISPKTHIRNLEILHFSDNIIKITMIPIFFGSEKCTKSIQRDVYICQIQFPVRGTIYIVLQGLFYKEDTHEGPLEKQRQSLCNNKTEHAAQS